MRGKAGHNLLVWTPSLHVPASKEEATMAREIYSDGGYELITFKNQESKQGDHYAEPVPD